MPQHVVDSPPTPTVRRPWIRALARRWPTLLALGMAALSWGIDTVTAGQLLPLLPLVYVLATVIRRRAMSWPILIVVFVGFVLLESQDVVDPVTVVVATAGAATVAGLIRSTGRLEMVAQAIGLIIFAGLAVLGLMTAPEVARWVLAAGWVTHGLWDLVHLRRNAVVSRSYAEWCGVFDILLGVQLLVSQ
jgi:hypothetical protein